MVWEKEAIYRSPIIYENRYFVPALTKEQKGIYKAFGVDEPV
jgi:hypothetical protein